MRVATYNIYGMRGFPKEKAKKDIEKNKVKYFTEVFNQLNCHILLLQEGVSSHLIQKIAKLMGGNLATIPSPCSWPGHIISYYPILESRVFSHFMPTTEKMLLSRCAGTALLKIEKEYLWVIDVHLHPGTPSKRAKIREKEARILCQQIDDLQKEHQNIIIAGDFNSKVDEKIHIELKKRGFKNAVEEIKGELIGYCQMGKPFDPIDHIYVSSTPSLYLDQASFIKKNGFYSEHSPEGEIWVHSDHIPVVASLNWPGEKDII